MPAVRLRHWRLVCAALIVLGSSPGAFAQARQGWHHHHHHHWQDNASGAGKAARPASTQPEANGFAVPTAQMIGACDEQAVELKTMPIAGVLEAVRPSDAQRDALEHVRATAIDTGNKLTGSCPKDVPGKLADRLDTMRASLDAIKPALLQLRPAFVSAYAALDDEQKARLVVLSIAKPSSPQSPQSPTAASGDSPGADDHGQPAALDCGQWPAMLKSWPVNRIEAELSLSDEQHAALYTLMAALYRAAGSLAVACHDDNALTPVARLDAELGRADALHQCIDAIAPALTGFVNGLNDEQSGQLNAMLGVAPQSQTTAR